jgi:hypothetical protein
MSRTVWDKMWRFPSRQILKVDNSIINSINNARKCKCDPTQIIHYQQKRERGIQFLRDIFLLFSHIPLSLLFSSSVTFTSSEERSGRPSCIVQSLSGILFENDIANQSWITLLSTLQAVLLQRERERERELLKNKISKTQQTRKREWSEIYS